MELELVNVYCALIQILLPLVSLHKACSEIYHAERTDVQTTYFKVVVYI